MVRSRPIDGSRLILTHSPQSASNDMPAVRENAYAEIAETSLAGSVRLARQASNVKPQACQYCQKRKRKVS